MIETEDLYTKLKEMPEKQRIDMLDPIIQSVTGKVKLEQGCEVVANRIFALAVLELYKQWQLEIYNRQ